MPYKKHPLLTKDVLKLPLSRRTKVKIVAGGFDTLQHLTQVPVPEWGRYIDCFFKEEEKEIIEFLKKHQLDSRLKYAVGSKQ